MSADDKPGGGLHFVEPPPKVTLQRLDRIDTFEVLAGDLDTLDMLVSEESRALAFATFCAGVVIPSAISWATTKDLSPQATAIYACATSLSAIGLAWFGLVYRARAKQRPKLLDRIRKRKAPPEP